MTESNLVANFWAGSEISTEMSEQLSGEVSHPRFRQFEVNEPALSPDRPSEPLLDRKLAPELPHESTDETAGDLISLRQEIADLKQILKEKEVKDKNTSQLKTVERLKQEIKNLKLELNNTESTAQALQRSLHSQLQHNWEQQQHEIVISFAKLQTLDRERLALQETQIQDLNQQKLLLEQTQQELTNSLEAALIELAQNTKALQKIQANGLNRESNRESSKNISLQSVLEQSLRSLQNEYTNSQNRIKDLESQIGELQEQILKQSGQAVEYEAAVQHWKEKCTIHQNHALQLSAALERFIDGKDIPKIADPPKVDLPSFLVRQRS